jgi:hypothetical protein
MMHDTISNGFYGALATVALVVVTHGALQTLAALLA